MRRRGVRRAGRLQHRQRVGRAAKPHGAPAAGVRKRTRGRRRRQQPRGRAKYASASRTRASRCTTAITFWRGAFTQLDLKQNAAKQVVANMMGNHAASSSTALCARRVREIDLRAFGHATKSGVFGAKRRLTLHECISATACAILLR